MTYNAPSGPGSSQRQQLDSLSLGSVFRMVWRRKWLVLSCGLFVGLIGAWYAQYVARPLYTSSVRLTLEVRDQQVINLQSVISGISTDYYSVNTELERVRSRDTIGKLVDRHDLTEDPAFNPTLTFEPGPVDRLKQLVLGQGTDPEPVSPEQARASTIDRVLGSVDVSRVTDSYLFDIRATTGAPEKSAQLANALAEVYIEAQLEKKFEATEYAIDWLSRRVSELEKELAEKERAAQTLRNENQIVNAELVEASSLRRQDVRQRLDAAQEEIDTLRSDMAALETALESGDFPALGVILSSPNARSLADAALSGDENATARLRLLARQALDQLQQRAARAQSQSAALSTSLADLGAKLERQQAVLDEINALTRDAEATRVLYETLLARLKETSIQIGLLQPDSQVITSAVAGRLIAPRKKRIVFISTFLGMMIGTGMILVQNFAHSGVRTREDLEAATGLPVLGQIPRFPIKARKGLREYLVANPTSSAVEAVRNMRTSVIMSSMDQPPQVIMLTSSVPGEGKTTASIALAQNFAGLGRQVLLIDCDIRRNMLSSYFPNSPRGDLVKLLSGETGLDEAIMKDDLTGVGVLFGSHSKNNPTDLFSSDAFRNLVADLRQRYDIIIIDTPPTLIVPDARVIGQVADAILFLSRWDATPVAQINEGIHQMRSVGHHITGTVLTQINMKAMQTYGYYGYDRYAEYTKKYHRG